MRPVDVKVAFTLTGRIVLLGFILCVGRESDIPLINLIGVIYSHFDYSIRWFLL